MASIALLTADTAHAAATNTRAALVAAGHTVTLVAEATVGAHDFSAYTVVLVVRATGASAPVATRLRALLDAGKPLVIGQALTSGEGTGIATQWSALALTGTATIRSNTRSTSGTEVLSAGHPITHRVFPLGRLGITTADNFTQVLDASAAYIGTALLCGDPSDSGAGGAAGRAQAIAIEAGTPHLSGGGTTGARVLLCGWIYAGQSDYTADGKLSLDRMVRWAAGEVLPDPPTQRRVSTAGVYVIDATPRRQVSTAGVYVIHGPNQRRVSTAGVYVVESQAPPPEPTVTAPAVLTPGASEVFPRGTTEVTLSWSPSTETSAPTTPLRYDAQWRAVGASTWNALFTWHDTPDVLEYAWTGLTGGAREVRVGGYRQGEGASQIAWSAARQFSIAANQKPTTPQIVTPAEGEVVTETLVVSFLGSTDPDGDAVTYSARMRKTGTTPWLTLVDQQAHEGTIYFDLTTLSVSGSYEIELWAADSEGLASDKALRTFTTDPSAPTQFTFTAPESGSEHNNVVVLRWEAVPGALSYTLRYQKPGEITWTTLTTTLPGSATSYNWDTSNTTTYPEGEYAVEGWAVKDGVAGPSGYVVVRIDRTGTPVQPTLRVLSVGAGAASLSATPYQHPSGVAHKATQFQVFYANAPEGDTVRDATFPAPVITYSPSELPSNALLGARVRFQDQNNRWSEWSAQVFFSTEDLTNYTWRSAWEVIRAGWNAVTAEDGSLLGVVHGGANWKGCKYAGIRGWDSCPLYEPAGMIRIEPETYGSARVAGYGMIHQSGHKWWAWKWLTSDSNKIGVMLGDGMDMYGTSNSTGAMMWLDCGVLHSLNSMTGECAEKTAGHDFVGKSLPNSANICVRVRYKDKNGNRVRKNALRRGIGAMYAARIREISPGNVARYPFCLDWTTDYLYPWYRMELKVQRYLNSSTGPKSVVYARGSGMGLHAPDVLEDDGDIDNGDHYWHLRVEVPGVVLECGYPGYSQHDHGGLWGGASRDFGGLSVVRLPDLGRPAPPETLPPPDPREPAPDVPCTVPQPEAAPEAPALFPVPPDWDEGVRELVTHPTDVIAGQDDSEQRIRLREHPRRSLRYTALCLDAGEVAYVQALLWERQGKRWAAPLWTEGAPLSAPLAAGAVLIPATTFDATDRRFQGRTRWALWQGVEECELLEGAYLPPTLDPDTGEVLDAGGIALADPTTRSYGEWAVLLPVELGWMKLEQRAEHEATTALRLDVEFTLDADGAT